MKKLIKHWQMVLSVFLGAVQLSCCLIAAIEWDTYQHNHAEVEHFAKQIAQSVGRSADGYTQRAKILSELVLLNPQDISWFDRTAAALRDDSEVLSLQLYREGNPAAVYPPGAPLMEDSGLQEYLRPDSADAANASEAMLYGPIRLKNGSLSIAAVQPVYTYDRVKGFQRWGAAVVLLRVPTAQMQANFNRMEANGYAFSLQSLNTDDGEVILHSVQPVGKEPIREVIPVPNGRWILEMQPVQGWFARSRIMLELFVGILMSALLAWMYLFFLRLCEQRERMRIRAVTDSLTQLGNRRVLMERLEECCARPRAHFLLCYMDLNDFKKVNDQYGHDIGDALIRSAAERIHECLKEEDTLFRIGGDEFVAILEPESASGWKERTEHIGQELRKGFSFGAIRLWISVSIGCAIYPQTANTPEGLLRVADLRMFNDKERAMLEKLEQKQALADEKNKNTGEKDEET